jgi:enamine deaminase RidA (YjgF/YER057c/UK114 family)
MPRREINAPDAPVAAGGYAQAVEITGGSRLLYISGQIPVTRDGYLPADFEAQAALAWANLDAQLRAASMTLDNLVKVTIFLSDREYAMANRTIRARVLGDRKPALTVIITGIFDPAWLLEIEGVAVA